MQKINVSSNTPVYRVLKTFPNDKKTQFMCIKFDHSEYLHIFIAFNWKRTP